MNTNTWSVEIREVDYALSDPTTKHLRTGSAAFSMASFGIAEDPDAESRRKRGRFFAIGVFAAAAVAALMISRASHETVAPRPVESKPAPVAAAPPPPPEVKPAAPAVAAAPPETAAPEEKAKSPAKRAAARHHVKR